MDKSLDLEEQYDKIYRYCYFRVRGREKAEDITQETFLRFLESKTYRDTGKALRYLYATARNLCIDEYRKGQVFGHFTGQAAGQSTWQITGLEALPEEPAQEGPLLEERLVDSLAVRAALERLKEEERELVLLRYVNEVPVGVIGELLGISRFAVRRRIREALRHLRENLEKENFK